MPTLTTIDITTISEYMQFVESSAVVRWYRGVGDATQELLPSLYRHPSVHDSNELFLKENQILKRFKQRSVPYLTNPLRENDGDLSTLFLMQHFGVPTRLLDWTENPYLALFFGLTSARYDRTPTGPQFTTDVAIWVLKPIEWNNTTLPFDPPPGIISPPDTLLNSYLPAPATGATTSRGRDPVALLGIHNSPRIVAQKGVFTLFGSNVNPMEQTYQTSTSYPADCLVKLSIGRNLVGALIEGLTRIGITDSVVYPDLEGLAREIKREFGYWV